MIERAKEQQGMRIDLFMNSEKGLKQIDIAEELASRIDSGHETALRIRRLHESKLITDNTKDKLRRGEMSINEAYKELRSQEKAIKLEESRRQTEIEAQEKDIKPIIFHTNGIKWIQDQEPCDLLI
ncbi:MAG: hypothetical protein AB1478_12060, partial [Nitrospirota bacterium]